MDRTLFSQFTSFLEEKWVKRIKTVTGFISRISNIKDIIKQPQVMKVASSSKNIKNFLDVLDDVSTFNLTKMNPNGLLVKSINSSKTLTTFLTKNATKIEGVFKYVSKLNNYFPNTVTFVKRAAKYFKITGITLGVVDFGYKMYKNYNKTKSIPKTLIGATVDSIKDFNILDGVTYGSFLGTKGAIAGVIVGGTTQLINLFNPNFFDDAKQRVFGWYDSIFKKKPKEVNEENEFKISKEVIYDRIQFYSLLVSKIEAVIIVLRRFSNQFEELASGKTAISITKVGIEKLINKCKSLLDEHIRITLDELKQFQKEMGSVFHYDQLLNQYQRNTVVVNRENNDEITKHLNQSIQCCNILLDYFKQESQLDLASSAIYKLQKVQQDLENQKNNIENLKNTTIFLEGLNFYE